MDTVEGSNGPPPAPTRLVRGSLAAMAAASSHSSRGSGAATPEGGGGGGGAASHLRSPSGGSRNGGGGAGGGGGSDLLSQFHSAGSGEAANLNSPSGRRAAATPEKRLQAQKRVKAVGAPPSPKAARGGGGGVASSDGGEAPPGPVIADSLSPAMQMVVDKLVAQLGAKDFRERCEAVSSLAALAPRLATAPDSALVEVLDGLSGKLTDANSKVAVQVSLRISI